MQGRVVQLVRDPLSASPAPDRLGPVVALRREEGAVRECVTQLTVVAGAVKNRVRRLVLLLRGSEIGRVPVVVRDRPVRRADRHDVGQLPAQRERLRPRLDRVGQPVGEVELRGQCLQQLRARRPVVARVPQGEFVERDGLAVGAGAGRLGPGGGRVPQDAWRIAGRDGVVGERAGVGPGRLEGGDHRLVQRRLGAGGDGAQDRGPGDLVPEGDTVRVAVDQPGGHQRIDGRRSHAERAEQSGVGLLGRARQQLQVAAHRRGQGRDPRDDGVTDAVGQGSVRLRDDLADEERVARRPAVHVVGVDVVTLDEPGDGRAAQRSQLQAAGVGRRHEVAENRPQRMVDGHRVAVGQHQEQRQGRDPAGEEPHEVQRRLVTPVQVFDDQDVRRPAQGLEHGGEDLVLRRPRLQQSGHRGVELRRHVAQWAERARGDQRIAHSPQDSRPPLGQGP